MSLISEITDKWLEGVQVDLVKNYERLGLKASGNWEKQLEPFNDFDNKTIKAGILGEKYTGALENGRKKTTGGGSGKLRDIIRQWIDDKGIKPKGNLSKDSLAFLITRKIHREGIKVPNKYNKGGLVTDVVTKKRIKELIDNLSQVYLSTAKSEIIKTFK